MKERDNKFDYGGVFFNAFENHIEYSCYADQYLAGLDLHGEEGDLIAFDECIDCGFYENIRKAENLKHALDSEYKKHVTFVKDIMQNDKNLIRELGLIGVVNYDIDSWIEHVKMFYISILSNSEVLDYLHDIGIGLEDIENAIEMMILLEENIFENKNKMENEIWN